MANKRGKGIIGQQGVESHHWSTKEEDLSLDKKKWRILIGQQGKERFHCPTRGGELSLFKEVDNDLYQMKTQAL